MGEGWKRREEGRKGCMGKPVPTCMMGAGEIRMPTCVCMPHAAVIYFGCGSWIRCGLHGRPGCCMNGALRVISHASFGGLVQ